MKNVITGFHSIEEILKSKGASTLKNATLCYSSIGPRIKKILDIAKSLNVKIIHTKKEELDRHVSNLEPILQNHKGIVLLLEDEKGVLNIKNINAFIENIGNKKQASVILLDGISDCHNMGAIIRSAEQFGFDAVIVPKRNSAKGDEVILKMSAGAATWMNIIEVSNLNQTISFLKDNNFWIFASDMEGESLCKVKFPDRIAIVMGSEGQGISRLVKKNCDTIISIPTFGKIDSLNVSVAAGIFMYELKRQSITNNA